MEVRDRDLCRDLQRLGIDPAALGPFAAVVEAVDALVAHRLREAAGDLKAARASAEARATLAAVDEPLHPDHVYSTAQAAKFLGLSRAYANQLPHDLIPHEGGRWRGVDIMAYTGLITRGEAAAYKEAQRRAVRRLLD